MRRYTLRLFPQNGLVCLLLAVALSTPMPPSVDAHELACETLAKPAANGFGSVLFSEIVNRLFSEAGLKEFALPPTGLIHSPISVVVNAVDIHQPNDFAAHPDILRVLAFRLWVALERAKGQKLLQPDGERGLRFLIHETLEQILARPEVIASDYAFAIRFPFGTDPAQAASSLRSLLEAFGRYVSPDAAMSLPEAWFEIHYAESRTGPVMNEAGLYLNLTKPDSAQAVAMEYVPPPKMANGLESSVPLLDILAAVQLSSRRPPSVRWQALASAWLQTVAAQSEYAGGVVIDVVGERARIEHRPGSTYLQRLVIHAARSMAVAQISRADSKWLRGRFNEALQNLGVDEQGDTVDSSRTQAMAHVDANGAIYLHPRALSAYAWLGELAEKPNGSFHAIRKRVRNRIGALVTMTVAHEGVEKLLRRDSMPLDLDQSMWRSIKPRSRNDIETLSRRWGWSLRDTVFHLIAQYIDDFRNPYKFDDWYQDADSHERELGAELFVALQSILSAHSAELGGTDPLLDQNLVEVFYDSIKYAHPYVQQTLKEGFKETLLPDRFDIEQENWRELFVLWLAQLQELKDDPDLNVSTFVLSIIQDWKDWKVSKLQGIAKAIKVLDKLAQARHEPENVKPLKFYLSGAWEDAFADRLQVLERAFESSSQLKERLSDEAYRNRITAMADELFALVFIRPSIDKTLKKRQQNPQHLPGERFGWPLVRAAEQGFKRLHLSDQEEEGLSRQFDEALTLLGLVRMNNGEVTGELELVPTAYLETATSEHQVHLEEQAIRAYAWLMTLATYADSDSPSVGASLDRLEGERTRFAAALAEDAAVHERMELLLRDPHVEAILESILTSPDPTLTGHRDSLRLYAELNGMSDVETALHLIAQLVDDEGREGWFQDLSTDERALAEALFTAVQARLPKGHILKQSTSQLRTVALQDQREQINNPTAAQVWAYYYSLRSP